MTPRQFLLPFLSLLLKLQPIDLTGALMATTNKFLIVDNASNEKLVSTDF